MTARALCRLDESTADRLVKLCGMFGSDHGGERASAARLADKLVRQLGLTWRDIIRPREITEERPAQKPVWREPVTLAEAIAVAMRHPELITEWERGFLESLRKRRRISEKQSAVVDDILDKIRAHVAAEAA